MRHKIVAQRQASAGIARVASALVLGRPPARLEPVRPRQQAQHAVVAGAVALHRQPPGWAQQPGGPQGGIGGFCTGVLDAGVRSILAQHLGRRAPLLHAFGPVVGLQHGGHHMVGPQAGRQALKQLVQGLAGCSTRVVTATAHAIPGRQQTGTSVRQRGGFEQAQRDLVDRCRQCCARQVFRQQAPQVRHVLRGLGGAHRQGLRGGNCHAINAPQVVAPGQLQRQCALLARLQPALQGREAAADTPEQRIGRLGQCRQLGGQRKLLGQLQPGMGFGGIAQGLIQHPQYLGTKTPGHPGTRQRPQAPPSSATHALQAGHMRAQGGQRVQRQALHVVP